MIDMSKCISIFQTFYIHFLLFPQIKVIVIYNLTSQV